MRGLRRRHDPLVCRDLVELVTDYLEGALPRAEQVRFESHLSACEACRDYVESLRLTVESLRRLADPPPDPQAREGLLRAFRDLRC